MTQNGAGQPSSSAPPPHRRTRRAFVGALAGAGLAASLAPVSVAPLQAPAPPARHVVTADGHPLTVWSRSAAAPRFAVLLVHGRTWSSLPDFDLHVEGRERSVMRSLAARQVAAYAVDLRGHGATPRDATGWLTPARAAADVRAVLAWVGARHPSLPRPVVVGWSRGAAVAMLAVQDAPSASSALVLYGFAYDPAGRFAREATPRRPARASNTRAAARADFISPDVTTPDVVEAFVEQALRADPIGIDLRDEDQFNALDPARVAVPVLMLHGSRDPTVIPADVENLRVRFGPTPARVISLTGGDHAAHLEDTHEAWVDGVVQFMSAATSSPPVRRTS